MPVTASSSAVKTEYLYTKSVNARKNQERMTSLFLLQQVMPKAHSMINKRKADPLSVGGRRIPKKKSLASSIVLAASSPKERNSTPPTPSPPARHVLPVAGDLHVFITNSLPLDIAAILSAAVGAVKSCSHPNCCQMKQINNDGSLAASCRYHNPTSTNQQLEDEVISHRTQAPMTKKQILESPEYEEYRSSPTKKDVSYSKYTPVGNNPYPRMSVLKQMIEHSMGGRNALAVSFGNTAKEGVLHPQNINPRDVMCLLLVPLLVKSITKAKGSEFKSEREQIIKKVTGVFLGLNNNSCCPGVDIEVPTLSAGASDVFWASLFLLNCFCGCSAYGLIDAFINLFTAESLLSDTSGHKQRNAMLIRLMSSLGYQMSFVSNCVVCHASDNAITKTKPIKATQTTNRGGQSQLFTCCMIQLGQDVSRALFRHGFFPTTEFSEQFLDTSAACARILDVNAPSSSTFAVQQYIETMFLNSECDRDAAMLAKSFCTNFLYADNCTGQPLLSVAFTFAAYIGSVLKSTCAPRIVDPLVAGRLVRVTGTCNKMLPSFQTGFGAKLSVESRVVENFDEFSFRGVPSFSATTLHAFAASEASRSIAVPNSAAAGLFSFNVGPGDDILADGLSPLERLRRLREDTTILLDYYQHFLRSDDVYGRAVTEWFLQYVGGRDASFSFTDTIEIDIDKNSIPSDQVESVAYRVHNDTNMEPAPLDDGVGAEPTGGDRDLLNQFGIGHLVEASVDLPSIGGFASVGDSASVDCEHSDLSSLTCSATANHASDNPPLASIENSVVDDALALISMNDNSPGACVFYE